MKEDAYQQMSNNAINTESQKGGNNRRTAGCLVCAIQAQTKLHGSLSALISFFVAKFLFSRVLLPSSLRRRSFR